MNLILLGVLAVVGVLMVMLLDNLIRRPVAALWVVLALVVLEALLADQFLSIELAGFRIAPADLGFGLVAGAAFFRFLRLDRSSTAQKAVLVFAIAAVISLVSGVGGGPIERAVNEFRAYLGFIAAALYFSTVRLDLETRVAMSRAWMAAGIGLGTIVLARWLARLAGFSLGIFDATDPNSGFDATIRVLNGPHTLMLTTCALVLLLPGIERGIRFYPRERIVGIVLLIMSIALNRRTLWIALAIVFVVLLVRNRRLGLRIAAMAFASVILFALALPLFQGTAQPVEAVAQPIDDSDTLVWRFDGWVALLDTGPDTPDEVILGLPFGTGYSRYIGGVEVVVGPHNFYLQTYLRMGLLGLVAFVSSIVLAYLGLSETNNDENHPLAARHLIMLMILLCIWMLTWTPLADQGVVLGLAVATAVYRDGSTAPMRRLLGSAPRLN